MRQAESGKLPLLLVSAIVFVLLLGWVDQVVVAGEQWSEEELLLQAMVRQRASSTENNIILTRKALLQEEVVGAKTFFEKYAKDIVIDGWTIIHLQAEDIAALRSRYERNLIAWKNASATARVGSGFRKLSAWGGEMIGLHRMFENSCGQTLKPMHKQGFHVVAYQTKPVPTKDYCRDYMLILAANGIIVSGGGAGGALIAEQEE